VNLYPNPTAPLIPLYPNSPVGETRQRQNLSPDACGAAAQSTTRRRASAAQPCQMLPGLIPKQLGLDRIKNLPAALL
jgi:hypothetical protein